MIITIDENTVSDVRQKFGHVVVESSRGEYDKILEQVRLHNRITWKIPVEKIESLKDSFGKLIIKLKD